VWDFLNQKGLWINKPTATEKIDGRAMTEDELYNFAKRRGGYLRDSLSNNLDYINGLEARRPRSRCGATN
jgi:hypothetical protein